MAFSKVFMKFLAVDDDRDILNVVTTLLELKGFKVTCCENALDAIQQLGLQTFDILITDATMPSHSGFDLIRTIRKNPSWDSLTMAMLTGRSDKGDIQQALKLGVKDYIVKPIQPELFLNKIDKLIEKHQRALKNRVTMTSEDAEMHVPIKVSRITDIGITIDSPHPLPKDFIVRIDVTAIKQAGIKKNRFKTIFSTQINNSGHNLIEFILLDIDEDEQKLLERISRTYKPREAS